MEAALLLLALFLSAMALLPSGVLAQSNQVVGLVTSGNCASPTVFVAGAKVTLNDANGIQTPVSVTTGTDGSFSFTPATGGYWVNVTKSGYYGNQTPVFRFDGSVTRNWDICLVAQPPATVTLTFGVRDASSHAPIYGATIGVYNMTPPGGLSVPQFIRSNVTNSAGNGSAPLWGPFGPATSAFFQLRTSAPGYMTATTYVNLSTPITATIDLVPGGEILGHARTSSGLFLSSGLVARLYDPTLPPTSPYQLITGVISISLFDFHAPAGRKYQMIVDANGYAASNISVTVPAAGSSIVQDAVLKPAPPESYRTTVVFGAKDWNALHVFRNVTLNADSTVPGLTPASLRNLRYQIAATFGSGSGNLNSAEASKFGAWLQSKGPFYITTDSFLLTNGEAYNSTTSYSLTVANLLGSGPVWINETTTYALKAGLPSIPFGGSKYYVNATLVPDQNVTVYQDFNYTVQLPSTYEMISNTIFGTVTLYNYTHVVMDPGIQSVAGSSAQVKMVVQPARNGTARAKVIGPVGKFYVTNATYQNYRAYVANNTAIQFSAADSTNPPSNDPARANYTWRLENGTACGSACTRYGIQPTFTYTVPGAYSVNLTMVGSGGNRSWRDITIWVDGTPPTANFRTNLTGSGSAVGRTLLINQGSIVRFDGALSTDLAYSGQNGVIPDNGFAWDFNGDRITDATGRVVNYTFQKPGQFTVNLTVTDGVGLKGANATMTVRVNDTQAPTPSFVVQDPKNEFATVPLTGIIEGRNYTFNASHTTDNYDPWTKLNYTWTVPGPIFQQQGVTNHTFWGPNVTWGWTEFNLSYSLKLTVKDTGFGSGKPNWGNLTTSISVGVDKPNRPDLYLVVGTLKVSNTNPQSGDTITVRVNVSNKKPGYGTARAVTAKLTEVQSNGQRNDLSLSPTWLDPKGNPLPASNETIASGATVTLEFIATVVGQGNMTLVVHVEDAREPYTWITAENNAQQAILVNQPGWVNYAIIGSVVGVFAVIIFAMYYRRKVKAGDWQSLRGRREKREGGGEKEKPRKEKEVKEEKKRL